MLRFPLALLLFTASTLAATVAAQAQRAIVQPVRAGGAGYLADPIMLLRIPQVQEELQLAEQQKAQLKEIDEQLRRQARQPWEGLKDIPPEQQAAKIAQWRKQAADAAAAARKKVEAILSPQQAKRLRQIALQMRMRWQGLNGIAADLEVVKQLGLDEKQQAHLKQITDETQRKLRELPEKIMAEGRQRALEVLTPDQRKKLDEVIGEKFELIWPQARVRAATRPAIIRGNAVRKPVTKKKD